MKKKSLSAKKIKHKFLLNSLKKKEIYKIYIFFDDYLSKNISKKKFAVAVSGGSDSLALAYFAKCYSIKKGIDVKFYIVDHKLRNNSSAEAKSVKLVLKNFGIDCDILIWNGKKPKSNIQSIARHNRYKLLKKECKKNNINYLLIGHHIDDLYENFFIRLLRGSGLRGLSSFGELTDKENKIKILRPLINFEKKELLCISRNVFDFFIEDPSNKNFLFQRIRIRKILNDLKNEGLDKKKLDLTMKNLKLANSAINFYVEKNIEQNAKFIKFKNTYVLNNFFFNQSEEVIFRSITLILRKISGKYYSPRGKSIMNLILKVKLSKANKLTLGGCYIEKINETTLITREN